ncbi:MAG TPA: type I-B CRISPR-associated protein Cas5 [Deltaproteobacteria bacterium]|mgnify:CR=1 FL=1|nr:type I-B CRISPR-associated protein Cas5 [Deltaproteobacteria bacterium]
MKVFRIHLSAWTASFRFPNLISAYQPTLPVPPLATINGLVSAAAGVYFVFEKERVGYVLTHSGKTTDLETIYQMGRSLSQIKSNVIRREFLSDVNLYLYTDSSTVATYFQNPVFQMLLGRSGDLAQVVEVSEIEVEQKESLSKLKGTIIPFRKHVLPAPIQALPKSFSNTIPRRNEGTQPYYLLDCDYRQANSISAGGFEDKVGNVSWDVYWQEH